MLISMSYLVVFIIAFMLTLVMTPLSARLGRWLRLTDRPGGRRAHQGEVPRTGGIALFAGFVGAGLLVFALSAFSIWPPMGAEDRKLLTGVLTGSVFVFLFGLWDDWRELPAWPQFAAQFAVALIAISFDIIVERVTLPIRGYTVFPLWITYPLTIFWIMGMINTVNWLDGLDGLAAGVAAIASLLFAVHAYSLGQTVVALFPLALAAACLGFLPFNFQPARIFMGSSGSMLLGFALASLSILAPAKVATALLVLGIPILDVVWLIIQRWRLRGNPAMAGRDHLHYRLLNLGFSQRQIVLLYYSFCAAFGLLALLIEDRFFKLVALAVLAGLTLALLGWLAKRK
ncbi:MAG: undecaprenyl/decaprenyl-phosphate alpha-N-acetylglucosaminyl 1-phosphate transferase [Anaerolineales bacterium]|nr:undecaprenyl/decaprenyl-phosphate alpha-N-acetylglucosaminyl 1-phosphate transferase [Anaerolineales bacterium]